MTVKIINFITLFQYFDNKEILLSEQIEQKCNRILYSKAHNITVADLQDLLLLKTRLVELLVIEKDLMSLMIDISGD